MIPRRSRTLVRLMPKMGLCSRTEAFDAIRARRVTVNGKVVSDPNKMIADGDSVKIDGRDASKKSGRYIIFNKSAGCVTTCRDERSRQTVYDIMGDVGCRVFPVGRLDKDSEGLLIFTNDTKFGDFLTDPANRIPRTYAVTVAGTLSDKDIVKMRGGVDIGRGERSVPVSVKVTGRGRNTTSLEITLSEGKNREIRRLCETMGAPVTRLVRVSFGPFSLGDLPPGKWRELDAKVCKSILEI